MEELTNQFTYNFVGNLNYINDGEPVIAKTLTIKAPTNKNIREAVMLEQEYERSQLKIMKSLTDVIGTAELEKAMANSSKKDKKEDDLTKESIIKNLMGGGADLDKCFTSLKKILLSGNKDNPVCLVDDKERLTDTIYADISFRDIKNLLGEYFLSFIITSQ